MARPPSPLFNLLERLLDELVDELKLEIVAIRDVLDLTLTADINAEMHVMADADVDGLSSAFVTNGVSPKARETEYKMPSAVSSCSLMLPLPRLA